MDEGHGGPSGNGDDQQMTPSRRPVTLTAELHDLLKEMVNRHFSLSLPAFLSLSVSLSLPLCVSLSLSLSLDLCVTVCLFVSVTVCDPL